MSVVLIAGIILLILTGGLRFIARWDEPVSMRRTGVIPVGLGVLAESILIQVLWNGHCPSVRALLGIFAGCLLLACITDSELCQVYNFVWWPAYAAGGVLLVGRIWQQGQLGESSGPYVGMTQLILFIVLQFFVFARTYGKADCYAFCACALVITALGAGMEGYLIHMILAYLSLIVVQMLKKNIARNGRLKQPVPFLPYINFSFWLTIFGLYFS